MIILTFNEEIHIEQSSQASRRSQERIIIVDSFSTGRRTIEIARRMGAEIYGRAFKHQAEQFQWALDNCNLWHAVDLQLDADEYLEAPLVEEILARLPAPETITGVDFKRKFYFMGSWIRWGGYYPIILTRLWRTGLASIEQDGWTNMSFSIKGTLYCLARVTSLTKICTESSFCVGGQAQPLCNAADSGGLHQS